jgi:type I restriction enzyme R subunit
MEEAGYGSQEIKDIRQEVKFYEQLRSEVKLHSGDAIDLKMYEPAMRHLIDAYIKAADTEVVSAFDDMSLIQLIVERGPDAVEALPGKIKESHEAVAETIENNVRKLIIEETPVNPKYYESMSELLDALIEQRRQDALDYQDYLEQIVQLTRDARNGPRGSNYPASLDTPAKRALFDNLEQDEALALAVDQAVRSSRQDAWRDNKMKIKRVKLAIKQALDDDERLDEIVELAINQHEY